MPPVPAALGFSLHTGWAAAVVVTGDPRKVEVILRLRLELLPSGGSIPRFVYHTAAEMPLPEAAALVKSAERIVSQEAHRTIEEALEASFSAGRKIVAAGIPAGSTKLPGDLSKILAAHTLIHAAEGHLFSQAIVAACQRCGVHPVTMRLRDIWGKAAAACEMEEKELRDAVDSIRKAVGPPWSADQKIATIAALLALRMAA